MNRQRPASTMYPDDVFFEISEITDYLYLSGAPAVKLDALKKLGITCVINVTELPNLPAPGLDYVRIVIEDSPLAKLSVYFDNVADKIEQQRRRGGRTLVHCVAGVSRSASLVLAHLVKHGGLTLRAAFQLVRSRRPVVRPNAGFFRQLIEYERRLRGSSSVRMVKTPLVGSEPIPDVYESEYRRLLGWTEWLRNKNLAHRVNIFRSRGSRGSTGATSVDKNGNVAESGSRLVEHPAGT